MLLCCAAALLLAGCGNAMTPEQAAAISKYQNLGGDFFFQDGGYRLELNDTKVEDKNLDGLSELPTLTSISFRNTAVTDAGLKYLEPIKTLKKIDVTYTLVTPEGIDHLQKALPDVEIRR